MAAKDKVRAEEEKASLTSVSPFRLSFLWLTSEPTRQTKASKESGGEEAADEDEE